MCAQAANDRSRVLWLRGARQTGVILLVALVPAVLAAWVHPRRPAWSRSQTLIPEVEWAAVQQWRNPVLLIDARGAAAYEREHIPGALWLGASAGYDGMIAVARAWQPGGRVVVYCDSPRCDAAQVAALRLQREMGIPDVVILKGGWSAWTEAHKPAR
jgi:rhodanese-related sulfurtransferase